VRYEYQFLTPLPGLIAGMDEGMTITSSVFVKNEAF